MTVQPEHIEKLARSIALTLEAIEGETRSDIGELREEVAALGAQVDAMGRRLESVAHTAEQAALPGRIIG